MVELLGITEKIEVLKVKGEGDYPNHETREKDKNSCYELFFSI